MNGTIPLWGGGIGEKSERKTNHETLLNLGKKQRVAEREEDGRMMG